jgi:hypothetical protein
MKTVIIGISISFIIMGLGFMFDEVPTIFVQHMVGLILITLALIIWNNKWK